MARIFVDKPRSNSAQLMNVEAEGIRTGIAPQFKMIEPIAHEIEVRPPEPHIPPPHAEPPLKPHHRKKHRHHQRRHPLPPERKPPIVPGGPIPPISVIQNPKPPQPPRKVPPQMFPGRTEPGQPGIY